MEGIRESGSPSHEIEARGSGREGNDGERGDVRDLRPPAARPSSVSSSGIAPDSGIERLRKCLRLLQGQTSKVLCSDVVRFKPLPTAGNSTGGVRETGLGCMD